MAQARTALRAVVADEVGDVIIGAKLTLMDTATQETREATTDATGRADFAEVPLGEYVLKAEKIGFQRLELPVRITDGATQSLALRLRIEVKQEVTVAALRRVPREYPDAPIDLTTGGLAETPLAIGSGQLLEFLRNFVEPAAEATGGLSIVVDGSEVSSLSFPIAAVDRVVVNKTPYSAEYRRPGKARVEVISESGSRRYFEGNVGMSMGNSVFDARNAFARDKPQTDTTLLEGGFAGPLPGRQAAFFLSGERLHKRQSRVVNAQTLAGPLIETVPKFDEYTYALGRVDVRPNDLLHVMVRYDFTHESERNSGVGGLRLAEQWVNGQEIEHGLRVRANAIFSSGFANDLRVSVDHQTDREGRPADGAKVLVRGAFEGGSNQIFTSAQSRGLSLQNAATYSRGAHTIRFGGRSAAEFLRQADRSNFGGTFEFADLNLFAAGIPSVFRINEGSPDVNFSVYDAELFFQDDVRLTPTLTVAMGARYDWQSILDDSDNLAPRLSVSFAPGEGKTVLRGGAGLFYDRLSETTFQKTLLFDGTRTSELVIANPAYPDPLSAGEARVTPPSLVRLDRELETPRTIQASLSVEREVLRRLRTDRSPRRLFFTIEYSHLHGSDMFRVRNINSPLPGTGVRPDPSVLNLTQVESTAMLRSHSVSVSLTGRLWWRFDGTTSYTYSNSTDDVGESLFRLPANNYDLTPEKGRADFDIRHKFYVRGVFNLPGDDFNLGAFLRLASGAPFDITTGFDDNGDTEATDRPVDLTRNTGQGPGFAQLDLRLTKGFEVGRSLESVAEPSQLLLSVDAFNVLNRTNFDRVIGVQSSPLFGQPNSARAPRSVQLSVRYRF